MRVTLVVDIRDPGLKTKDPKKGPLWIFQNARCPGSRAKQEIVTGPTTLPRGGDPGTVVPFDAVSQNLRSLSSPAEVLPATSIADMTPCRVWISGLHLFCYSCFGSCDSPGIPHTGLDVWHPRRVTTTAVHADVHGRTQSPSFRLRRRRSPPLCGIPVDLKLFQRMYQGVQ